MKKSSLLVALSMVASAGASAQGFGAAGVNTPVPAAAGLLALGLALFVPLRFVAARRVALTVAAAGALVLAGAPAHAVGAAALLVLCLGAGLARAQSQPRVLFAAGSLVVAASVPLAVAEQLAVADLHVASALFGALGLAPTLDGSAIHLAGGYILVDPACAAVEGVAIAFVISLCLRFVVRERTVAALGIASAHAAAFLAVNLARIVLVGVAMSRSSELAQSVHDIAGFAMLLVHVPFLVGPLRRIRADGASRVARVGLTGTTAVDPI